MKPPVFIVGPHRAGSTLWHNLIAMCPGVVRLADPFFLGPRRQRDFAFFLGTQVGDLATRADVERMVELCFARKNRPGLESSFWRFEDIEIVRDPEFRNEVVRQILASDRSVGATAKIIVTEITRFSGGERACMKFPVDLGHLPQLLQWFPDCKIVHITRDPRGLAVSKTNDPSGTAIHVLEHPGLGWLIKKAAIWLVIAEYWRSARVHRRFKRLGNYRLFRYEDLLANPRKVLKDLCQFIDAEFTEHMLHPEESRHEHQPSSLTGKRQKKLDPAAAIRWQVVISKFDNRLISLLTKRSMKKLDYNPWKHPIFRTGEKANSLHLGDSRESSLAS